MPKKSTLLVPVTLLIIFALFLSGCGRSSVKPGWRETSSLSNKIAQYASFDGADQVAICIEAGQTVSLDYEVTVNKGTLGVALNGSDCQRKGARWLNMQSEPNT